MFMRANQLAPKPQAHSKRNFCGEECLLALWGHNILVKKRNPFSSKVFFYEKWLKNENGKGLHLVLH